MDVTLVVAVCKEEARKGKGERVCVFAQTFTSGQNWPRGCCTRLTYMGGGGVGTMGDRKRERKTVRRKE